MEASTASPHRAMAETGRLMLESLNLGTGRRMTKRQISEHTYERNTPSAADVKVQRIHTGTTLAATIGPRKQGSTPQMWSEEEDTLLRKAVKTFGDKSWKKVAEEVPGRNHLQCMQRWKKALKPGLKKGQWEPEEDKRLLGFIRTYLETNDVNHINWQSIAKQIEGRNSKQCRERWFLNLDPSINRGPWTPEEDRRLLEFASELGGRWALISKSMPGRTENAVKTRFHSLQRQEARTRDWSSDEDLRLLNTVNLLGRDWAKVAKQLPGRSRGQLKKRFAFLSESRPGLIEKVQVVEAKIRSGAITPPNPPTPQIGPAKVENIKKSLLNSNSSGIGHSQGGSWGNTLPLTSSSSSGTPMNYTSFPGTQFMPQKNSSAPGSNEAQATAIPGFAQSQPYFHGTQQLQPPQQQLNTHYQQQQQQQQQLQHHYQPQHYFFGAQPNQEAFQGQQQAQANNGFHASTNNSADPEKILSRSGSSWMVGLSDDLSSNMQKFPSDVSFATLGRTNSLMPLFADPVSAGQSTAQEDSKPPKHSAAPPLKKTIRSFNSSLTQLDQLLQEGQPDADSTLPLTSSTNDSSQKATFTNNVAEAPEKSLRNYSSWGSIGPALSGDLFDLPSSGPSNLSKSGSPPPKVFNAQRSSETDIKAFLNLLN